MDAVRTITSLGRKIREEVKIKVRQPLSEAILDGKKKTKLESYVPLIIEELNVKDVVFIDDLSEFMNIEVKPNFKLCGKIFGSKMKDVQEALKNLTDTQVKSLENNEDIIIEIDGQDEKITSEMVELRITSKEGFSSSSMNNQIIVLNTTVTEELKQEGYAREIISKVQNLRKEKDFQITDRITIYYNSDDEIKEVFENFKEMISKETLAKSIEICDNTNQDLEINDKKIYLNVEKCEN